MWKDGVRGGSEGWLDGRESTETPRERSGSRPRLRLSLTPSRSRASGPGGGELLVEEAVELGVVGLHGTHVLPEDRAVPADQEGGGDADGGEGGGGGARRRGV